MQEIQLNDGKTIKVDKTAEIDAYKCQRINCDKVFFSKDDLDQHRIYVHGILPKSLEIMPTSKSAYFNRLSAYKLTARFQREAIKRTFIVMGIDMEHIKRPLMIRIKRWLHGRRINLEDN